MQLYLNSKVIDVVIWLENVNGTYTNEAKF